MYPTALPPVRAPEIPPVTTSSPSDTSAFSAGTPCGALRHPCSTAMRSCVAVPILQVEQRPPAHDAVIGADSAQDMLHHRGCGSQLPTFAVAVVHCTKLGGVDVAWRCWFSSRWLARARRSSWEQLWWRLIAKERCRGRLTRAARSSWSGLFRYFRATILSRRALPRSCFVQVELHLGLVQLVQVELHLHRVQLVQVELQLVLDGPHRSRSR